MRILLVGNGPLPDENTPKRYAAGLRTWQLFSALQNDKAAGQSANHQIHLVTIAEPNAYDDTDSPDPTAQPPEISQITPDCNRYNFHKKDRRLKSKLQKLINTQKPDVIIAANNHPSYLVSKLKFKVPFWADLNGWLPAEVQAQAYRMQSDAFIPHFHKMQDTILRRADKFSTVSTPQQHAITGQLASIARLNSKTFGYQFIHSIPNSPYPQTKTQSPNIETLGAIPQGGKAFNLFWLGGYNTWVDQETLFHGVDAAMKRHPNLYYISTGGGLTGLDSSTYETFKQLVNKSPHKDRYIFLGWVHSADIPHIYSKVHAGLNIDLPCDETTMGARNRLNEMLSFSLPVITTLGSEISYQIQEHHAGLTIPQRDSNALASAITTLIDSHQLAPTPPPPPIPPTQPLDFIKAHCLPEITTAPLLHWLQNPALAPDHNYKIRLKSPLNTLAKIAKYLKVKHFSK